jgi:hypothetical protein
MAKSNAIEVVISWDTTGSMYPCLSRVEDEVESLVTRLFRDIPDLKVGCIAHGDYCDASSSYVIKTLDLTKDPKQVVKFVRTAGKTNGGDAPECYELVLHEGRKFSWTAGKNKAMVVMGDDVPHAPAELQNSKHLDWRNELDLLLEAGVKVYGVQCLNRSHATFFWKEVAQKTGGMHITLDQFDSVRDLLMAICYQQQGHDNLKKFEKQVAEEGRMNRNLDSIFGAMLGRAPRSDFKTRDLDAVDPSRFQMMTVKKKMKILAFVEKNGLDFQPGKGFYEFTKSEKVQPHKEVVLIEKRTGDMFSGKKAREMMRLPKNTEVRINPKNYAEILGQYSVMIQSTSYNRDLVPGQKFLYEVDMSR